MGRFEYVCPRCKEEAEGKPAALYGKVSEQEYLAAIAKSNVEKRETNLREDFEISMDNNGKFSVTYSCRCKKCGFSYEFNFEKDLMKPEEK